MDRSEEEDEDAIEWSGPSLEQPTLQSSNVTLVYNKSKWLDDVSAVSDRTVTSCRTAVQLAATAVTSAVEGDAAQLTFSKSTLHRRRKRIRKQIAQLVTNDLKQELNNGHKFILHWDEKMMSGRRLVDNTSQYMAVVLTNTTTGRASTLRNSLYSFAQ